ncbi:MAG: tRNA dihydrouridine(20/20a) synthase DusA [Robiginitomaculum sp.]|nr:MAG: tRNA dihydrouridine(20/20a) synthase DusA [Robiginitomaculum sp.]
MNVVANHKLSVAPMMDWTDRHCRFFHRLISRHAQLYTEMVTAKALIHGDAGRLLRFDAAEHPVVLQLGGAEPAELAMAAKLAEEAGYGEINLNVGCPSDRVQSGAFGAALMAEPDRVAECVAAMKAAVSVPVTIKCRLGIDDQNPEETLPVFIETVKAAPCQTFIIHARKAWLKGLSPKDNRTVPPLDYDLVRTIKEIWPDLTIILNGGMRDIPHAMEETKTLDGAMLGRAAYQTPWVLADVDAMVFGDKKVKANKADVVQALMEYAAGEIAQGTSLHAITRHIYGLFSGEAGARLWRRTLSEMAPKPGAGPEVIAEAAQAVLGEKWAA